MTQCINCKSTRIAGVSGKTSDMCYFTVAGKETDGYVPENVGITDGTGYGDYIDFEYCLDCGTIQGKFPISKKAVKDALNANN